MDFLSIQANKTAFKNFIQNLKRKTFSQECFMFWY